MPVKKALKIGEVSSKYRFDWPNPLEALEKLKEEISELEEGIRKKDLEEEKEELGDCFFSLIQISRHLKIDPLEALHQSNEKFQKRFQKMLELIEKDGKSMENFNLDQMHIYWTQAKLEVK